MTVTDRLTAALADRYRIERELGAGGMATVFLASDLKHDRKVAIKVLKPELAAVLGAERFVQEIKTTAALSHPHILPLLDSGEADGLLYYVMPFIEGETIRDRLNRETQFGIDEAVKIATEVADALDYAHRRGVIHRDIKPENILLHDGRPIVMDFGIALAVSAAAGGRMTETGLSLGTPHYMSPEQATADRDITARSDIYSLASVLYEMLTGNPPHMGSSAQQIIMKIIAEPVQPVTAFRKNVAPNVAAALAMALEKLPADRFGSARAFADALGDRGFRHGAGAATASPALPAGPWKRITVAVGVVAVAIVAAWGWLRPVPELIPSRLSIPVPTLGGSSTLLQRLLDITPDGRTLIYIDAEDGRPRVVSRRLDDEAPTPLPKVPGLFTGPVISPDGREFIAANALESQVFRFPIEGGEGRPLPREVPWSLTMAWSSDGTLWVTPQSDISGGIVRVSKSGEVTHPFPPERNRELSAFSIQQVLPGDRYALAVRNPVGTSFGPAHVFDLETGAAERLFNFDVVEVRYTAGLLVYVLSNGAMEAVRFNLRTRRPFGAPVTIATDVSLTGGGTAHFAVARNGTVAYVPEASRTLLLIDRAGAARPALSEGHNFHIPRFSRDGRQLLTDYVTAEGRDVWRIDLASGAQSRVTFDRDGHDATWEPDGRHVSYISATRSGGALTLYRTVPGRASEVDSLISNPGIAYTGVWLPDGSAIVTAGNSLRADSRSDIAIIRNAGRGPLEPLVATRFEESFPAVSPDGRWLAYTSDQTGTFEVYVRPLDRDGEDLRVSLAGGGEPVWGPDGRELFYRAPVDNSMMLVAASLTLSPVLAVVTRRELFDVSAMSTSTPHSNYDISPDGRTFAMVRQNPATRIVIIQNLPSIVAELERGGRQ